MIHYNSVSIISFIVCFGICLFAALSTANCSPDYSPDYVHACRKIHLMRHKLNKICKIHYNSVSIISFIVCFGICLFAALSTANCSPDYSPDYVHACRKIHLMRHKLNKICNSVVSYYHKLTKDSKVTERGPCCLYVCSL